MNNCSSLKPIEIPLGYKFESSDDEIYSYFIPTRILHGNKIDIPGVEEHVLYGSESPDELFGSRQDIDHIYFFTSLKKDKPTHSRARRGAGGGKWHAQKPTPCVRLINDKKTEIGTMRQFTYRGGVDEWIMHEYAIDADFLKLMLNDFPNHLNVHHGANLNPENIVFCHIYKKKAKKAQIECKGEACQAKKRKTIADNNEIDVANYDIINNEDSSLPMNNPCYDPQPNLQLSEEDIQDGNNPIQYKKDDFDVFWIDNFDNFSLPEDEVVRLLAINNPQAREENELSYGMEQQHLITQQESSTPNFFTNLLLG